MMGSITPVLAGVLFAAMGEAMPPADVGVFHTPQQTCLLLDSVPKSPFPFFGDHGRVH